jgi:hypothetical protein
MASVKGTIPTGRFSGVPTLTALSVIAARRGEAGWTGEAAWTASAASAAPARATTNTSPGARRLRRQTIITPHPMPPGGATHAEAGPMRGPALGVVRMVYGWALTTGLRSAAQNSVFLTRA